MNDVRVNSVWVDLDPRMAGRTFRVERIHTLLGAPVAVCTILTNAAGAVTNRIGQRTSIKVGRFTEANYKLIKETT